MIRKFILLGMMGVLIMAGCGKKEALQEKAKRASEPRAALAPAEMAFNKSKPFQEVGSKRYVAIRYHFTVETSEAGLEKAWESMTGFCENIHCDILESTICIRMASNGPCIRRKHSSDPYLYRCSHPLVGPDHSGRLVSTQIVQESF